MKPRTARREVRGIYKAADLQGLAPSGVLREDLGGLCFAALTTEWSTPLDGILMANSQHHFKDKAKNLRHARNFLKPKGILLLVEYNVDSGNPWVPHPLSFESFRSLAPRVGFSEPRLLTKHPSSFLREFYSALCQQASAQRDH